MRRIRFEDQLRKSLYRYTTAILIGFIAIYLGILLFTTYIIVVQSNRQSGRETAEFLQSQYTNYQATLQEMVDAPEIQQALTDQSVATLALANRALYAISNAQQIRAYFVLTDASGEILCSNLIQSNQATFERSAFSSAARRRLDKVPGEMLGLICDVSLTESQACSYTFCQWVEMEGAGGYLFLNLRQEDFKAYMRTMLEDMVITDDYSNIIYSTLDLEADPQDKLPSSKFSVGSTSGGVIPLGEDLYYLCVSSAADGEMYTYTLTSLEMQLTMLWWGLFLFVLLFTLLLVLTRRMTRSFAQSNGEDIQELVTAVEALEIGPTDFLLSERCSQEFEDLYESFRRLTLRRLELMEHNSKLLEHRRLMEVKRLEEQFNPHFVYNVMETVRYQIIENPEVASDMVVSFANLMRYSINYGQARVRLEVDIEYVNDYLLIQKIRYNHRLTYSFKVSMELMDCWIPKLLLQPLVENSIMHGYVSDTILHIDITAHSQGDTLYITVQDNGAGIDPNRLSAIRESFTMDVDSYAVTHIGLYNIEKVLLLLYGPNYGMTIDSQKGVGTTIVLSMPLEMEE